MLRDVLWGEQYAVSRGILSAACGGAALGVIVSVLVNNALAEISISPFFAVSYGCIFVVLGALVIYRKLWERHDRPVARWLVLGFSILVLCSGVSCFLLEKDWFRRISYTLKVPLYVMLGIAVSFTVSCTLVDIVNAYGDRCGREDTLPLVQFWSSQQVFLILAGAVAIGASVGLLFGSMDVEDHLSRIGYEGWTLAAVSSACGAITGGANAYLVAHQVAGGGVSERSQLNYGAT